MDTKIRLNKLLKIYYILENQKFIWNYLICNWLKFSIIFHNIQI